MAVHPITSQFEKIRALVTDTEADVAKADNGNHAAGVRETLVQK
jgi:hypothetical protein